MLMLTRSCGQAVEVTDTRTGEVVLRLTVTDVRGRTVRLGFESPRHFHILRDDAITREPKGHTDGTAV